MKIAKLELAATTGMRDRDMDLDYFGGLDSIMTAGINALNDLLINPWLGLPLFVLGLIRLWWGVACRGGCRRASCRARPTCAEAVE